MNIWIDTFKKLFTALVRPTWNMPVLYGIHTKTWKDITTLENVQRRATEMVPGLGDKSYEDRLKRFKITNTDLQENSKGYERGFQTC